MIFCGWHHNIILNEKNEIYVCGDNDYGQLGLGDNNNRNTYVKLEHNFGIIKNIFCGGQYNIILNTDNELYVCGNNEYGQLGLGDNKQRNIYEKLEHNFGVIKNIYCNSIFNILLNENNEIYVCGNNYYGQLGLGDTTNRDKYIKLKHNFGIIKNIYCGRNHSIILNENNELYVCGYNGYGQLGLGDTQDRKIYVSLKHNFGFIKNISCGSFHNIILNESNDIFVCGWNHFCSGQLGLDNNKDKDININIHIRLEYNFGKIKDIFCGPYNNIILSEKNELYVCGDNYHGQLGLGDEKNRNIYEKISLNFRKIKNIFCGGSHNIILNVNNEIYVCGNNIHGQLGLGDNEKRNTYVKLNQNILEYIPNIIELSGLNFMMIMNIKFIFYLKYIKKHPKFIFQK
jgi:alpha-tubulin suppressor-like RCC1 family protein